MFNRSEIMKAAWTHYRKAVAYAKSNPYLAGAVVRFADCLKEEWRRAKLAPLNALAAADPIYKALVVAYNASLVSGGSAAAGRAMDARKKELANAL